jgi:N-acetylglucosaminyldiphosphoundecaprenol N-acetyl-beta-D-mannosaminyltransferase
MNSIRRSNVLGYSILDESAYDVAQWVCEELLDGPAKSFVFLNPHSVVLADQEPIFRSSICQASGIFCDGVGLSLAARWLNHKAVHRVYGFEFFVALSLELSARRLGRIFFLGGDTASIQELRDRYRSDYPGVEAINFFSPPYKAEFSETEIEDMGRRITESRTEVLWVGLGSPKQEKILHRLMQICDVKCGAAVGAVFDFYTGRVAHSPAWVRKLGLQWAHRLMLEPRRLWRRTIVSMPKFVWRVLLESVRPRPLLR